MARYSAPAQSGPGDHADSFAMGTGSFPGGKERPGRDADPSPLLVPCQERVGLYLYSPYGPYGLYRASVPVNVCTLLLLYCIGRWHLVFQSVSQIWNSCPVFLLLCDTIYDHLYLSLYFVKKKEEEVSLE